MCLFNRKKQKEQFDIKIMPIEKIIEVMYNKNLQFSDNILDVIYSKDKTKRYVVLQRICDNNYTFAFENLEVFDTDELQWIKTDSYRTEEVLPAYWSPAKSSTSLFALMTRLQVQFRLNRNIDNTFDNKTTLTLFQS